MKKTIITISVMFLLLASIAMSQIVTISNFTGGYAELINVSVTRNPQYRNITYSQKPFIVQGFINVNNYNPKTFDNYVNPDNQTCSSGITDCNKANDNNAATIAYVDEDGDQETIQADFNNTGNFTDDFTTLYLNYKAKIDGGGSSRVTLQCYNYDTSSYTTIKTDQSSNTIFTNTIRLNDSCVHITNPVKINYQLVDNLIDGIKVAVYEYELQVYHNYTIQIEDNLVFTNQTNASTSNYLENITTQLKNSIADAVSIFNFSALYYNTFETNITVDVIYNTTINVSIKDPDGSILNPSCTYNGFTVNPKSQILNYTSSLNNNLSCSLSGYVSFSQILVPYPSNYTNITMNLSRLILTFYDEETNNIITQNLSLILIHDDLSSNSTFINGNFTINDVPPGELEMRYGGGDYRFRSYFVNVTGYNNQINLYTIKNTSSSLIVFQVVDEKGNPIPNSRLKIQKYFVDDNAYSLIAMENVDENGYGGVYLKPNTEPYILIVEKNNVIIFQSNPRKIFTSTVQIQADLLTDVLTSHIKLRDSLTTNLSWNNDTKVVSYLWNDASGITLEGCLEIIATTILNESTVISSCTSSSSATITINLTNYIKNNTAYTAKGYVETNTTASTYFSDIMPDFIKASTIYERFGNMGLFLGYLFILTMFFLGLPNFTASLGYSVVSMIILNLIGVTFFGYALIISVTIVGIVFAKANRI